MSKVLIIKGIRFYLGLVCLLGFSPLFAQVVNVEQTRLSSDSNSWTGKIDATLQYQNFNEVLTNATGRMTMQYKSRKYFVLGLGELGYSGSASVEYVNNLMLHLRYGYRMNRFTRMEVLHQVQRNPLIGINRRMLHGLGPRLRVYADSLIRLHWGTVAMHETELAIPISLGQSGVLQLDWRSSSYLNLQLHRGLLEFSGTVYYQPLFRAISDYRISGQYSLSVAVSKRLSLNQEFTHYFDSDPPSPLAYRFMTYTMGLGYIF
jgi:hypothetical protein